MPRVKVTDDELDIIKGLRNERAIYNGALEDAARKLATIRDQEFNRAQATHSILALRKEGLP